MKKIIIGIIVLMLIVSMGYIIFVSGEEWGFDTTDINSMRFKVNINFKDGTTTTLSTNPMIIMFNDKIVESITYYVDIKGSSEVYDVFEIQNYGLHYKLTDSTNTYKDKTFYNTDIKSFSANNQWYTLFEKTITCNDMEITSDISPTLSYGEYKIQLNGYFQYRYGDINWMEYNMDSTSLTVNYVEDTLTLDVTGGINLDNDDGDDTGDIPPDWDPPEEDDTEDNDVDQQNIVITNDDKSQGNSLLIRTSVGQTFNTREMKYIETIKIYLDSTASGKNIYSFRIYDENNNDVFNENYDTRTFNGGWNTFVINKPVTINTVYTFKTSSANAEYRCTFYNSYFDGYCIPVSGGDLLFEIHGQN